MGMQALMCAYMCRHPKKLTLGVFFYDSTILIYFLCGCFACMHAYGGQKKASDPLELEL